MLSARSFGALSGFSVKKLKFWQRMSKFSTSLSFPRDDFNDWMFLCSCAIAGRAATIGTLVPSFFIADASFSLEIDLCDRD